MILGPLINVNHILGSPYNYTIVLSFTNVSNYNSKKCFLKKKTQNKCFVKKNSNKCPIMLFFLIGNVQLCLSNYIMYPCVSVYINKEVDHFYKKKKL